MQNLKILFASIERRSLQIRFHPQNFQIRPLARPQTSANNIEIITPQSNYSAVSQLVTSRYLFEIKKEMKKVLRGKKLKAILEHDYSQEEFENLPLAFQNLIAFDRAVTTAEILQFMEAFDKSHEITFQDYNFDRIKFRALFEALGSLVDIEMQSGPNTYVPLSDNFGLKKKIKEIFSNIKDTIKSKLS